MAQAEGKGVLERLGQQLDSDEYQERRAALDAIDEPDEVELLTADRVKRSVLKEEDAETADSIRLYLREIGRVPLLTAADEVSLAQRMEGGLEAVERAT